MYQKMTYSTKKSDGITLKELQETISKFGNRRKSFVFFSRFLQGDEIIFGEVIDDIFEQLFPAFDRNLQEGFLVPEKFKLLLEGFEDFEFGEIEEKEDKNVTRSEN